MIMRFPGVNAVLNASYIGKALIMTACGSTPTNGSKSSHLGWGVEKRLRLCSHTSYPVTPQEV